MTSRNNHITKLEHDLDACREICSSVDSAKFSLNERLSHVENLQQKAEEERLRLSDELSMVNAQLEREHSKVFTLESVLKESRQECMQLTINNNNLVERLEDNEQNTKHFMEKL